MFALGPAPATPAAPGPRRQRGRPPPRRVKHSSVQAAAPASSKGAASGTGRPGGAGDVAAIGVPKDTEDASDDGDTLSMCVGDRCLLSLDSAPPKEEEGKGKEEEGRGKGKEALEEEGKGWVFEPPYWWRKRAFPSSNDPDHSWWRGVGFKEGFEVALDMVDEHLTQESLHSGDPAIGAHYTAMLRRLQALRRRTC